jgi:hypothetical protein
LPLQLLHAIGLGDQGMLPFCPAILDIYDGIEMLTTQLHLTSRAWPWMQIMIVLAVIVFHISSFLEIHYLMRYSELENGPIISERIIWLGKLLSSFMFLFLRVLLFAFNPHEMFFAVKTILRIYYHYKNYQICSKRVINMRLVNLRPGFGFFAFLQPSPSRSKQAREKTRM